MQSPSADRSAPAVNQRGQASILGLGVVLGIVALAGVLLIIGRVYVQRASLQRTVDVAASAYALGGDDPARAAQRVAQANGVDKLTISASDDGAVRFSAQVPGDTIARWRVTPTLSARAEQPAFLVPALLTNDAGIFVPGVYNGPLVAVDAARICPAVGARYRAMQNAAAADGIRLYATSGFRSVAEQAALYAQLGPAIAAPPGHSLHQKATELDINVGAVGSPTHRWLQANASRWGFIQRYSWEQWHWGNVLGCDGAT